MADKKNAKEAKVVDTRPLNEQLDDKRKAYIEARRGLYSNELQNPRILGKTKKEIARIMTKINAEKANEKKGE